ncbi:putative chromatin remodeling & transcriptional activation HMG family [Helianthus annuus]|uniref:Chromatin remodeling & transcriptional activation HMG family n=1 Tax=Helianthus annuus TaxID=4232 RepID=A0A251S875_HELAN|nr:HMG-Y-related protein A [Helianthus annuus]KAF5764116.1 putative chromatin remodeling & transcriptional activation HMG family [Helianthus annuus]KAJ0450836.1 putative chromatin remodeling & transcriptional activation HMG family [Helianthus annuus]KAJ0455145.1 putative chromatin remodeling & transcriptional activation HMG family [Helianthus annuus]KAJ0472700.1 putative chromatin remodeling & transcriptional activation HMG family [Helianthus annuus]KAJ0648304.1 putative chromatin remodeling &
MAAATATEDATNVPAPAPVSILPQYPELIMGAIEALDSKKGACRSKISKQIEASYGSLPAAHKTLLSHHLNKMRASGELVVINNNYVKPDPLSPGRRGRGRPSKPKTPLPEGAVASPPRSRGRPRKSETAVVPVEFPTEVSPAPAAAVVSGRKRGRPPKDATATPAKKPASSGRGRGRPRKVKTDGDATPAPATGGSKGRGRPRKVAKSDDVATPAASSGEKKGRGRPRKVVEGGADVTPVVLTGEKRGRGRPRKVVVTESPVESD